MTSEHANTGARNPAPPPAAAPPPQSGRRFSTGAMVGAGLVGVALGALATFAITGLVWTVRVELPPPPYPPPLSGYVSPPSPTPPPGPGVVPPPLPPAPHG